MAKIQFTDKIVSVPTSQPVTLATHQKSSGMHMQTLPRGFRQTTTPRADFSCIKADSARWNLPFH